MRSSRNSPSSFLSYPTSGSETVSSNVFISSALEKILQYKEAKKNTLLKDAINAAKEVVEKLEGSAGDTEPHGHKFAPETTPLSVETAAILFKPLELACQTRSPLLQNISLDCVGKLIDYGYLADPSVFRGSQLNLLSISAHHQSTQFTPPSDKVTSESTATEGDQKEITGLTRSDSVVSESTLSYVELPDAAKSSSKSKKQEQINNPITFKPAKKERRPLIDSAIDIICDCFFGEHTDENVQMQIIKALLAAVTSDVTPIHHGTLLKAIRTTYNIFLLSRNTGNQGVAQGTLTQMINVIFSKAASIKPEDVEELLNLSEQSPLKVTPSNDVAGDSGAILNEQKDTIGEISEKEANTAIITEGEPMPQNDPIPEIAENKIEERKNEIDEKEIGPEVKSNIDEKEVGSEGKSNSIEDGEKIIGEDEKPSASALSDDDSVMKFDESEIPSTPASPLHQIQEVGKKTEPEKSVEPNMKEEETDPDEKLNREAKRSDKNVGGNEKSDIAGEQNSESRIQNNSVPVSEGLGTQEKLADESADSCPKSEITPESRSTDAYASHEKIESKGIAMEDLLKRVTGKIESKDAKESSLTNKMAFQLEEQDSKIAKSSISSVEKEQVDEEWTETKMKAALHRVYIKDAFLLLRALCKLSMKAFPEGNVSLTSYAMRSKYLSLQLVNLILKKYSKVFLLPIMQPHQGSEISESHISIPFVLAIKQHLILALSRNAVSLIPGLASLCLDSFCALMKSGIREYLKKEIEVFINEIFLKILEMKNSPTSQKLALLKALNPICSDPQFIVEIYLNFDCAEEAMHNMYERTVNVLSKATTNRSPSVNASSNMIQVSNSFAAGIGPAIVMPHDFTTTSITEFSSQNVSVPTESNVKHLALQCLVSILRSLATWANKSVESDHDSLEEKKAESSNVTEPIIHQKEQKRTRGVSPAINTLINITDDPEAFEQLRHKKQLLVDCIRKFNWNPKKGFKSFVESGLVKNNDPQDAAKFLMTTEGLSKAMIGEYLGEGDEFNISVMHAFVDLMEFKGMIFVDALRHFLQSFRLPGEAQKIDRFMLKFAAQYVENNSKEFANADTAYVLAYSVIMLNTDLHNPQVKNRMTKQEFIRNNRGINDNADLPDELLEKIYDVILNDEIILKEEHDLAKEESLHGKSSKGDTRSSEKKGSKFYAIASSEIADKTEAMLIGLSRPVKEGSKYESIQYINATHGHHVKPMFEIAWMPTLAGISGTLQTTEEKDIISYCLEGFRHAIRISSMFEMELERNAFVTTISNFAIPNAGGELKFKNAEAIKTILEIALTEGNHLQSSWKDILSCIAQIEKFPQYNQHKGGTLDLGIYPTDGTGKESSKKRTASEKAKRKETSQSPASGHSKKLSVSDEVNLQLNSSAPQNIVLTIDKIFMGTVNLSGGAIVHFVNSLCMVSWDEIQASGDVDNPRMFCLQKLVEIAYYNMTRIRMEWTNIWNIMGEHFNQVGSHNNLNIGYFALDSLRQLSMKFLEKEELTHYKFQKDFLKPFEFILCNTKKTEIKDLVLRCLQQMIQAKADNIKSGWKAMFSVLSFAAKENNENIVALAFDIVRTIFKTRFSDITTNGAFANFASCLARFTSNRNFPKTALHSIEILKACIPELSTFGVENLPKNLVGSNEQIAIPSVEDVTFKYWYPIFHAFYEAVMEGDLEVRTRALGYLFEGLKVHSTDFNEEFWEIVLKQIVYPIFSILTEAPDEKIHDIFASKEETTVWLSTTLIQALRSLVSLYIACFDSLVSRIDDLMNILKTCITQDNETLARIGASCLQSFIEGNASRMDDVIWTKTCDTVDFLFEWTTPRALFDVVNDDFILKSESIVGSQSMDTPDKQGSMHFTQSKESQPSEAQETKLVEEKSSVAKGSSASTSKLLDTDKERQDAGASPTPLSNKEKQQQAEASQSQPILATPTEKMEEVNTQEVAKNSAPTPQQEAVLLKQRRKKLFQLIIIKCVLQLLLIQTVDELLNANDKVWHCMSTKHLMQILGCIERSYDFAKKFNEDLDLRVSLWRLGFMKNLPNMMKQETTSMNVFLTTLFKVQFDKEGKGKLHDKSVILNKLIPTCIQVFQQFILIEPESKTRSSSAWRPVMIVLIHGLCNLSDDVLQKHAPDFYGFILKSFNHDNFATNEYLIASQALLIRIGKVSGLLEPIWELPPKSTSSAPEKVEKK